MKTTDTSIKGARAMFRAQAALMKAYSEKKRLAKESLLLGATPRAKGKVQAGATAHLLNGKKAGLICDYHANDGVVMVKGESGVSFYAFDELQETFLTHK